MLSRFSANTTLEATGLVKILEAVGPDTAVVSPYGARTTLEATGLGKIRDAAGPDTAVVSPYEGPHVLAEAFASYLTKLIE